MVQQSSFLSRGSSGGAVGAEGGGRGRGRGKWEQRGGAEGGGSGSRGGAEGAGGAVEVAFHTAHPWAVNHIQKSLIRRKSKTVKAVKQPWNGIRLFYTIIRWKLSNNFYFLCVCLSPLLFSFPPLFSCFELKVFSLSLLRCNIDMKMFSILLGLFWLHMNDCIHIIKTSGPLENFSLIRAHIEL